MNQNSTTQSQMYLQCDAEGCNHLEFVDTITEDMVGKPCPKCNANLLTKEDYDMFVQVQNMITLSNNLYSDDAIAVDIHCHDGKMTITPL